MSSKRFKVSAAVLAILLAAQLLVPDRTSAAYKSQQLPEPEWSYKLPEGYTTFNTLYSIQSKDRVFFQLRKKVEVSPSKTKYTTFTYASADRKAGTANWVYDYYDIANDKSFSGSDPYYSKDGNSYFYKRNDNGTKILLSAVNANGKLKWTKTFNNPFTLVVLDSGNLLLYYNTYHSSTKTSDRYFEEFSSDGKQVRKLAITKGALTTGTLEILPNGYIVHNSDQSSVNVYRSLDAKSPFVSYTAPKGLVDANMGVQSFSGGSVLISLYSTTDYKLIGFGADGKRNWIRSLNPKDRVIGITGNNYLVQSNNAVYRLYSKDNQLLGKQQIGELGDNGWNSFITPSGEITVEKQYQWQERPAVIDPETFEGDLAREDFYVLDPGNLQINYHLSTLWNDYHAGHQYIYAGKGELYLADYWFNNTLTKYILK
ncbi:hypothetical protein NST84_13270 [Paenibacillus sp. FSL R7-0345]|uniref:hypothetical protein n=1 Tax=Paenibacillus sp. FSL R7-0345 TaxID=2954535 RepID=UPI00315ABF0E